MNTYDIFYLASWGMYRGSSFLLQKDYKVHIPIVRELLKPRYDSLMGIACSEFKADDNQSLLIELNDYMSKYYDQIRREVKAQELKNQLSHTLINRNAKPFINSVTRIIIQRIIPPSSAELIL